MINYRKFNNILLILIVLKQAPCIGIERKNIHVLTGKSIFVFGLSRFLFSILIVTISSQIIFFTPIYASSNNNEVESGQDDSTSNAREDLSDEQNQNQQQGTETDETIDEVTVEQVNQCASEINQGPSYVDENGCRLPCPNGDDQTEIIFAECPRPNQLTQEEQEEKSSQISNNPNDPVTNENNSDTNIGFLDSGYSR